jgi:hypothetical protein
MSIPAERASAPTSWKETARTLGRATAFSFWSSIVLWRWVGLLPVFGVSAVIMQDMLQSSFEEDHISRRVDVWDLFPGMVSHAYMVLFLFGGGFMLVVGDSFKREQEQGAVAMAIVRMPSRSLYWLSKMGALGLMALAFVALAFLIAFAVGMVIAPPSSALPMLPRESIKWMLPYVRMPMPLYVVLLAGYTAWTLWIAGSLIVLSSLFIPHKLGVLGVIALWLVATLLDFVFVSTPTSSFTPGIVDYINLLDLCFFLEVYKHHNEKPIPLSAFFAITGALLALIAVTGARRLRREEL